MKDETKSKVTNRIQQMQEMLSESPDQEKEKI